MTRRKRKPIFIDEPIQWHLVTSKHDRCPVCGLNDVGYLGKTQRTCMNHVCGGTLNLRGRATDWYRGKLSGNAPTEYAEIYVRDWFVLEAKVSLASAQEDSRAGIAVAQRMSAFIGTGEIFWRKGDPWPYYYKGGKEVQACEPGARLYRLMCRMGGWVPSRKLSPLELLAREAPDQQMSFSIA